MGVNGTWYLCSYCPSPYTCHTIVISADIIVPFFTNCDSSEVGHKQSANVPFVLSLKCLFPGVWYHGSIPSRLHLECSSAESGAREPRILVDLQPNRRPDTLCALSGPRGPRRRRCPLPPCQYLLIPKILTPCSCGSLGMRTVSRETVLTTKWTRSYLV